ncbi:alkyl sulfatase C-terminal domain-containing protein [Nocardia niigatensis]|uniref:alkyl sulfatase C-terminal domain-containing protein n=1 Tax=Nocardia niigatensis TaxID=209249 RepID=UPI0002D4C4EA|nr:alkyl sulfatase C-terminal domain-containing protein [Nocardia niigatensis]
MWVRRGVLNARQGMATDVRLKVSGPTAALVGVLLNPASAGKLAGSGAVMLDGDVTALGELAALQDDFEPTFPIVTP